MLELTRVVVAADEDDRLSPGGLDVDIAPAPYDDDEIVEEFDGLCMLLCCCGDANEEDEVIEDVIDDVIECGDTADDAGDDVEDVAPEDEVVVTIVVRLRAGGGGGCVGRAVVAVAVGAGFDVDVDVMPTLVDPNRLLTPNVRGGFGGTGSTCDALESQRDIVFFFFPSSSKSL
jgi:hypothetical protein